jgi:hypothetical protein
MFYLILKNFPRWKLHLEDRNNTNTTTSGFDGCDPVNAMVQGTKESKSQISVRTFIRYASYKLCLFSEARRDVDLVQELPLPSPLTSDNVPRKHLRMHAKSTTLKSPCFTSYRESFS